MRRQILIILILVLGLAACAGGDADGSLVTVSGELANPGTDTTAGGEASDGADVDQGDAVSFYQDAGRKVIHRAAISIEAEDTRSVYAAVQAMVDRAGGFIESATVSDPTDDEDQPRVHMVIRVPAADLPTTLETIADLGTRVVSQSQGGEDVTEQYVDVEARVANLTLLETELRELLEDVRGQEDADPDKLLQVFNEISRVRGEIEQYQAQLQVLDDLTTLATIEVAVSPTPAVAPVVAEGWAPLVVAREALGDLITAFQGIGDLAIRFVVFVVPVALVVVGIPALLIWRVGRRLGVRRTHQPAAE